MDTRALFIKLLINNKAKVYYNNKFARGYENFVKLWKDSNFMVGKWSGSRGQDFLLFYSKRFNRIQLSNVQEVSEYVLVPSLSNVRWVILNRKENIKNHGLIIKPSSLKAKLVWWLSKSFNAIGLFNMIFPDRVLVNSSYNRISENLVGDLITKIIYTGAPGVFQKFTSKCEINGNTYYSKFACTPGGISQVNKEIAALSEINKHDSTSFINPQLIETYYYKDMVGFIQSDILKNEIVDKHLSDLDFNVFKEFYSHHSVKQLELGELVENQRINKIYSKFPLLEKWVVCNQNKKIELCLSHGDYSPWNRFCSNGKVKLIDWESLDFRPLLYDLCYFSITSVLLLRKKTDIKDLITTMYRNTEHFNYGKNLSFGCKTKYIIINCIIIYSSVKNNEHCGDINYLNNIQKLVNTMLEENSD